MNIFQKLKQSLTKINMETEPEVVAPATPDEVVQEQVAPAPEVATESQPVEQPVESPAPFVGSNN